MFSGFGGFPSNLSLLGLTQTNFSPIIMEMDSLLKQLARDRYLSQNQPVIKFQLIQGKINF